MQMWPVSSRGRSTALGTEPALQPALHCSAPHPCTHVCAHTDMCTGNMLTHIHGHAHMRTCAHILYSLTPTCAHACEPTCTHTQAHVHTHTLMSTYSHQHMPSRSRAHAYAHSHPSGASPLRSPVHPIAPPCLARSYSFKTRSGGGCPHTAAYTSCPLRWGCTV